MGHLILLVAGFSRSDPEFCRREQNSNSKDKGEIPGFLPFGRLGPDDEHFFMSLRRL